MPEIETEAELREPREFPDRVCQWCHAPLTDANAKRQTCDECETQIGRMR